MLTTQTADDFVKQLIAYLPVNWMAQSAYQNGTPTHGVLKAFAGGDAHIHEQGVYVEKQFSLQTAEGEQVDLIARDFFGDKLPRALGETDAAYKARIVGRIFTNSCTRQGMSGTIEKTVGSAPNIMERQGLANFLGGYIGGSYTAADVGAWGYNVAGMFYMTIDPYHAKITIKQAEPGTTYFMTVSQLQAFVDSIKPLGTVMEVQVIGPDSTGGVPIT